MDLFRFGGMWQPLENPAGKQRDIIVPNTVTPQFYPDQHMQIQSNAHFYENQTGGDNTWKSCHLP